MTPDEFSAIIMEIWQKEVDICRARLSRYGLHDDAEDVVQRAVEQLWDGARYATLAEKSTKVGMAPWQAVRQCLIQIIHDNSVNIIRRRFTYEHPTTWAIQHLDMQRTRENPALEHDIQRALECLMPDTRRAVELVYMEGFTPAEAARLLEIPERTIERKLRGARKVLVKQLQEYNTCTSIPCIPTVPAASDTVAPVMDGPDEVGSTGALTATKSESLTLMEVSA